MIGTDLADHPNRRLLSSPGYLVDVLPDMTPSFPRTGASGYPGSVQREQPRCCCKSGVSSGMRASAHDLPLPASAATRRPALGRLPSNIKEEPWLSSSKVAHCRCL